MIYQWNFPHKSMYPLSPLFVRFRVWFVSCDLTMTSFLWLPPAYYVNEVFMVLIQSKYEKIWTKQKSVLGHFSDSRLVWKKLTARQISPCCQGFFHDKRNDTHKNIFPCPDGRSISQNVAHLIIPVRDAINLLY